MMADQTADEAKKQNIAKMGEKLGAHYSELWQEIAVFYVYWQDYLELFGTKPERIELLNRAAPAFFHMLQEELWESRLLNLARLTDPTITMGKSNLTIQALPDLISDVTVKAEVAAVVETAVKSTDFCRDWRNRRIAHRDLNLALNESTTPLKAASRTQVDDAL
jgi:hypothetical protein